MGTKERVECEYCDKIIDKGLLPLQLEGWCDICSEDTEDDGENWDHEADQGLY